jgi:hypothetical protein
MKEFRHDIHRMRSVIVQVEQMSWISKEERDKIIEIMKKNIEKIEQRDKEK